MSGIIRIDMPKGVEDGSTSISPQSPQGSSLASPPISRKGAILLGYGAMTAKSVYNTAVQEIAAGGNEELATALSNATTGAGIAIGAIATGGLSLIPLGISTASQIYSREKSTQRQNRARQYEASTKGSTINWLTGGGYE